MSLGDLIRKQRGARGLTQYQLARNLNVTQSYMSQLESGTRKPRQADFVIRLAREIGVSADDVWLAMGQAPPDLVAALTQDDCVRVARLALNIRTPQ
jgi:transcriptional regulator with XRE-family HTH domain